MAALALGPEIFGQGFRFLPTPQDAVTYYLPRLVAGTPLHDAVRPVVHHADVYACPPGDLARHFCPRPMTGDRFFFSPKRASGATQASRVGSWQAQSTVDIKVPRGGRDGDAKVGELRKLRYKKRGGGGYTDWLMDKYSSCSGDGEDESQFVLCKMYVSPRAAPTSAAHKESAAYFFTRLPPPPPAAVVMQMQPAPAVAKRPAAPPQTAMSPPCAKRMRRGPILPPAGGNGNVSLPPAVPPQPSCAPSVLVPTRSPLAAVGKMLFAPPQPSCVPRRGSTTPSATQPSPTSAPPLAPPPVPIRPTIMQRDRLPMPLPAPPQPLPQQVPPLLPTPPAVLRACHEPVQSKKRTILDPFEAAMLRDEGEEQTVTAAPRPPPPPPAATPALQDQDEDDWDDLDKALEMEDAVVTD